MRRRAILAAATAAGALSLGGVAAAETPDTAPPPAPPSAESTEVTLPTGQTVTVAPDGTLDLGEGGAFSVTKTADGDRLAVPLDAVDEVAAGEYDAAAFNVDSPGAAFATEADDPEAPANVTLTGAWLDGTGTDSIVVSWVRLGTGEGDGPVFTDGKTAELSLDPGRYHLVTLLNKTNSEGELDTIAAITEVKVGTKPVAVVIDGTKAEPLGFDLDREAELQSVQLDLFSYPQDAEEGDSAWVGVWEFPGGDLYAIPTRRLTGGHDVGYVLREGLSSVADTAEPYGYNLFRAETRGLRGDLTPAVHDEDLARIDADYQSLGAEGTFTRQDLADHPEYPAWAWTPTGEVALPSSRTEFFTPGEDLDWQHRAWFPYEGGIMSPWDLVYQPGGPLEAGPAGETTWNNAPLSVGIDNIGQDWPPATFVRWDELEALYFAPWMFSSSAGGEGIQSEYLPGEITLSRDGEVLAQNGEIGVGIGMSEVKAGELTLTASADREATWTPLGTRSAAEWTFDYDPEGNPVLPVSVVEFAASGVVNGYAEAGTVQQIGLEFAQQEGADDQACAAMTFEVSFDDGATWAAVPIDRDGDTATAQLALPEDAAFASVRFTAADEAGNTVVHETIRSYGIA